MTLGANINRWLLLLACWFLSCHGRPDSGGPGKRLFCRGSFEYVEDSVLTRLRQEFKKGKEEHFNFYGTDFRFRSNSHDSNRYILEAYEAQHWEQNLVLPMPAAGFFLQYDYDGDGYNDLVQSEHSGIYIYFFMPVKHRFLDRPVFMLHDHAELSDHAPKLYGTNTNDFQTYKIDLFTLSHQGKYYRYHSVIFLREGGRGTWYDSATVYACKNGHLEDTSFLTGIRIDTNYADFGVRQFMKDIYAGKYAHAGKYSHR